MLPAISLTIHTTSIVLGTGTERVNSSMPIVGGEGVIVGSIITLLLLDEVITAMELVSPPPPPFLASVLVVVETVEMGVVNVDDGAIVIEALPVVMVTALSVVMVTLVSVVMVTLALVLVENSLIVLLSSLEGVAVGVVLNEDIDIIDVIEEDSVFEAVTVTVATQEGVVTRQTVEEGEREKDWEGDGLSTATPM